MCTEINKKSELCSPIYYTTTSCQPVSYTQMQVWWVGNVKNYNLLVWNWAGTEWNTRPIMTDRTVISERALIDPNKTCSIWVTQVTFNQQNRGTCSVCREEVKKMHTSPFSYCMAKSAAMKNVCPIHRKSQWGPFWILAAHIRLEDILESSWSKQLLYNNVFRFLV